MTPDLAVHRDFGGRSAKTFVRGKGPVTNDSESGFQMLVPIAVVLTLIAVVNSLQAFYVFFTGAHSLANFIRFLVSNLFYAWYFIVPALAVRWLSTRVSLNRDSVTSWVLIHLSTLVLLTAAHQILSLDVDKLVLGSRQSETLFSVLLNNPAVWGDIVVYVLFLLGFYMIEYRRKNQENELEYSQLEMELVRAQLHELRARIHPEFLFNTLSQVGDLVQAKQGREADKALSLLSDFLRATVYDNDREEATVEGEISFLDRYIAIEKMRFGDRLRATHRVDDKAGKAVVPNFIVQPIVEELVAENLDNSGPRCDIEVTANMNERMVEITIKIRRENGITQILDGIARENILDITRRRLEQIYAGGHEFTAQVMPDGSGIVTIGIPLGTAENPGFPGKAESL